VHLTKPASALLDIYFQTASSMRPPDAYIATLALDDNVYPVWEQLLGTLYLPGYNRSVDLRECRGSPTSQPAGRLRPRHAIGEVMRANFGESHWTKQS
jgi:hypothetical protein